MPFRACGATAYEYAHRCSKCCKILPYVCVRVCVCAYLLSVCVLVAICEACRCSTMRLQVVLSRQVVVGVGIEVVLVVVAIGIVVGIGIGANAGFHVGSLLQLSVAQHLLGQQSSIVFGLRLRLVQVVVELVHVLIQILEGQCCEASRSHNSSSSRGQREDGKKKGAISCC